ncbi:leucine-rich repeat protein [Breznakiellaceae bacterium SP9]
MSIGKKLVLAVALMSLGAAVFAQSAESDFETDGNGTITRYVGRDEVVVIPAQIGGKPVTAIGASAFYQSQLTGVIIPNSVTSIKESAFSENQLTSVTIPNSVTSIGDSAFFANKLMSVAIGNSVTSIGNSAFSSNQLTSIAIGNSVTSIGSDAFSGNQLMSVTIPGSVTSIGTWAFYQNQLTSVTIPNSVTSIGSNAFAENRLTSVIIPNSVTSIGGDVFANNQLTSVTIGNSVTSIESGAFANNQLMSIIIPSSVSSIGGYVFDNNQLTSVTIPANVKLERNDFGNSIPNNFDAYYNQNGKKAGTYRYNGSAWSGGGGTVTASAPPSAASKVTGTVTAPVVTAPSAEPKVAGTAAQPASPASVTQTAAMASTPTAIQSAPVAYKVGDRGPAGGFVFYDKGNNDGGWRYLEAAPANAEFAAVWDPSRRNVTGTKTETGSGKNNTQLMARSFAVLAYRIAGLNTGGYSDWFLPSKDELHLMYLNLSLRALGSFKDGWYWSSLEYTNNDYAWHQNFSNGEQSYSSKSNSYNVRAVRAFSTAQATDPVVPPSPPGAYKVGGLGPAGGIVFYDKGTDSDGWRYLEAAPASAEFTAVWDPNRTNAPGKTSEIGDGKKNTRLMADRFITLAYRIAGLNTGGYSDWFLPNLTELHLMYLNLSLRGLGSFKDGYYWASLESSNDSGYAYYQRFSNGEQSYSSKSNSYNVRAVRAFSTAQATDPVVPPPPPGQYKVGDRGPAGGLVFYDKGHSSDGWRYLEAAPASAEFTAQWDPNNTGVSNTQTGLGTGKENARFMTDRLAVLAFRIAGLNIGGFSDWFLPSKDELYLMYLNLAMKGLGNFKDGRYWSSSQSDASSVWYQNFSDGGKSYNSKSNSFNVRVARAF